MADYPSEEELKEIEAAAERPPWDNLIRLLREIWHWDDYFKWDGKFLELHTGGWSGNEDIIESLRETIFWLLFWQKSERGGHYYFTLT